MNPNSTANRPAKMALTTRFKSVMNACLLPAGLKVETRSTEVAEAARLVSLHSANYFAEPAFPVPACLQNSSWRQLIPVLQELRSDLDKLKQVTTNQVGFTNDNSFYCPPDSDVLYAMIRHYKPQRIVEIGSGNSTKVSRQAILDGKLSTRIVSIDPAPRADINEFADDIRRHRVEEIPAAELAQELQPDDFLLIDSSHLVVVGNDCVYEFLQLLPQLKRGVVVHVHDVSLPWDYPLSWIEREPQVGVWAEQYLLQAIIASDPAIEVLWPGYFVQQTNPTDFDNWFPDRRGRDATSFWMRRLPENQTNGFQA